MNKSILYTTLLTLLMASSLQAMEAEKEETAEFSDLSPQSGSSPAITASNIIDQLPLVEGPIIQLPDELIYNIIDNLFPDGFCEENQFVTSVIDASHFAATNQQFRKFLPEIALLAKKHAKNNEELIEALHCMISEMKLGGISILSQTDVVFDENLADTLQCNLGESLYKAIGSHQNEKIKFILYWINKLHVKNKHKKNIIKEMINYRRDRGETTLIEAIKKNNLVGLQLLLEEADKNKLRKKVLKVQDHYDRTLLHHIVFSISAEQTKNAIYLLLNKTNNKLRRWLQITGSYSSSYRTPLYWAIKENKSDTVSLLCDEAKKDMLLDELLNIKDGYDCPLKNFAKKNGFILSNS